MHLTRINRVYGRSGHDTHDHFIKVWCDSILIMDSKWLQGQKVGHSHLPYGRPWLMCCPTIQIEIGYLGGTRLANFFAPYLTLECIRFCEACYHLWIPTAAVQLWSDELRGGKSPVAIVCYDLTSTNYILQMSVKSIKDCSLRLIFYVQESRPAHFAQTFGLRPDTRHLEKKRVGGDKKAIGNKMQKLVLNILYFGKKIATHCFHIQLIDNRLITKRGMLWTDYSSPQKNNLW